MLELKRLIKADIIKMKSTKLLWMHLWIPLLGLAIMLGYYCISPWSSINKIAAYFEILCIAYPVLIGVITSMMADQEFEAGNYQNLLGKSRIKSFAFLSKYILCTSLGFISTMTAVLGFYFGFTFISTSPLTFEGYLVIGIVLFFSNLIQYTLHFFISLRFSRGVSIGLGVVEALLCALFRTGMGDGRWPFVPASWSIRYVMYLMNKYFGGIFIDPSLNQGIIITISGTLLSFILMLLWFIKWDGKRAEE